MIELLRSPWDSRFDELATRARSSLVVCAPYVAAQPCERLVERLRSRVGSSEPEVYVLTDLSPDNMLSGRTDAAGLLALVRSLQRATVRMLPSLHAKVYVCDDQAAAVTSGNFTNNGLCRNVEYGVLLRDPALVRQVRADVIAYGTLGSPVTAANLDAFAQASLELRELRRRAEASLRSTLRRQFQKRLQTLDDAVLRARAAGRSCHAIFADAIAHVLSRRPMTTPELHAEIQRIHPDLCDDSIDRVIDGEHFGRKWKHAVRTAQQHLKKSGQVALTGKRWALARHNWTEA